MKRSASLGGGRDDGDDDDIVEEEEDTPDLLEQLHAFFSAGRRLCKSLNVSEDGINHFDSLEREMYWNAACKFPNVYEIGVGHRDSMERKMLWNAAIPARDPPSLLLGHGAASTKTAPLLLGYPTCEFARQILSFTTLEDRRNLASVCKDSLEMVETYDELAAAAYKKKHCIQPAVVDDARNRIRQVARQSAERGTLDPAIVDSMEIPWRCMTSVLSKSALRTWDRDRDRDLNDNNEASFAISPVNDRMAFFSNFTIRIVGLGSSDQNGAPIFERDIDLDDERMHGDYEKELFLFNDLLLCCTTTGLMQVWSTETGESQRNALQRGDYLWAQSQDRIYALGDNGDGLHIMDAKSLECLNYFSLEYDEVEDGGDDWGFIFVCGKWLVVYRDFSLYVFDPKNACRQSKFMGFPYDNSGISLVQASDDEFTFYVTQSSCFFVLTCDEGSGIIRLQPFRRLTGEDRLGGVVAAIKGCAVVCRGQRLEVYHADSGNTRGYEQCFEFPTNSVQHTIISNRRRELFATSYGELAVFGLDEPRVCFEVGEHGCSKSSNKD